MNLNLPSIFCPKCSALILAKAVCPHCAWQRPTDTSEVGQLVWPAHGELRAKLGGLNGRPISQPAEAEEIVCFGTENAGLVAVLPSTGEEQWRKSQFFPGGWVVHQVVAYQQQFIVPVNDFRDAHLAEGGRLQSWSPRGHKLWEYPTSNFYLSQITVHEGRVYFATADRKLHCYAIQAGQEVWQVPLKNWSAAAPYVDTKGVYVLGSLSTGGGSSFEAFDHDGRGQWAFTFEHESTFSPLYVNGLFLFQAGKRLLAFDPVARQERWRMPIGESGPTSAPIYADQHIYIGGKGYDDQHQRVYALFALETTTGREIWRAPVGRHIHTPPVRMGETVLCGTDAGQLHAFTLTGQPQWSFTVRSSSEHIRTHLLPHHGTVLFGTRNGFLYAVRTHPQPTLALERANPDLLLQEGLPEEAAAVYALRGDLIRAAQIYRHELHDVGHALQLYKAAQEWSQVAALYETEGQWGEALQAYQLAADLNGEARMRYQIKDYLGAARVYEKAGRLAEAAAAFEGGGDLASAQRLYLHLGETAKALAIAKGEDRIQIYIANGELAHAAEEAHRQLKLTLAADLYQRLGQPDVALEMLVLAAQQSQTKEGWAQIPDIARSLGRFEMEAEARVRLGHPRRAAEAYYRAAQQQLVSAPPSETRAAALFAQAFQFYQDVFESERALECRSQYIRYARLPYIILTGEPSGHFYVNEFNRVQLSIQNAGFGLARKIAITLHGNLELDDKQGDRLVLQGLRDGAVEKLRIHLRPRPGVLGNTWVKFTVTYCDDRQEAHFTETAEITVDVHTRESQITHPVQPMVVHGNVYMDNAKHLQADEIQTGGHRGDQVVVNRVGLSTDPHQQVWSQPSNETGGVRTADGPTRPCPNCQLPTLPDWKFCQACQAPLE